MKNPYAGWSDADVLAHNQRVAKKNSTGQVNPHVHIPMPAKKRLRQSAKGPNKLEQAAWTYLTHRHRPADLHVQAVTLKLCNGVRFTPDIVAMSPFGSFVAYEVKGFMRDDAALKLKFAAKQFLEIKFVLIWREKGRWFEQEIIP